MVDTRFYHIRGPFSLGELIAGLDAQILDDRYLDEPINAASALDGSAPGDISFLGHAKFKDTAMNAKATACFVPEKLAQVVSAQHIIPIVSKAPRAHFARVVDRLYQSRTLSGDEGEAKIAKTANIHKSVVIGAGAVIANGVEIGPYSVIGPGVHIGQNTTVGAHVVIDCAVIGQDCEIKSGAILGGAGFGIAADEKGSVNIPHVGRVIIGDRVLISSGTCVDRGQLTDTELHDDVKIDNLVQIAHNVIVGEGTVIAGHVGISGSCVIGRGVQLGGNVGLADHVTIGDGGAVAARAGVMHNIPAGETWSGYPAMPIRNHMRAVSAFRKLGERKSKGKA